MAGPRNYTDQTLKKLFGLSGNQCAFPGCVKRLVNTKNALDSNICHIEAALPGGERYNPTMTDEQRADYENLILLCVQHHEETNDVKIYTVEKLKQMKRNHEGQYLSERIQKNPSMLRNVINAISDIEDINAYNDPPNYKIIDPNEKIYFNNLKENAIIIKEYCIYHSKLNALYDELESQGSIKKEKLLRSIKLIYDSIKGRYVLDSKDALSIIKIISDKIFNEVYNELYKQLENSGLFEEDITLSLRIIMVDAFIRCKILEEPAGISTIDHLQNISSELKS
jgi:hypothetical protein